MGYGVAAGVGGSFVVSPFLALLVGGGLWVFSDTKKYKAAGKGVVIGAGAMTALVIAFAVYIVTRFPDSVQAADARAYLARNGVKI